MPNTTHPRDACYFCGTAEAAALETHHVVPRRFGGSDDPENLVDVCASCHNKLEDLYGPRFYDQLAVYRRRGETPNGQRIPDNSAHFWVSYDHEGYRQYTCKKCERGGTTVQLAEGSDMGEQEFAEKIEDAEDPEELAHLDGIEVTKSTVDGRPAFFDQEEAIEHLEEEHNLDAREASWTPIGDQTPAFAPIERPSLRDR